MTEEIEIRNEIESLIKELCAIPAPSGREDERAEFCRRYLCSAGAKGVIIDDSKSVIYPVLDGDDITLFIAHTDTVFSDTVPMELRADDEYLYAPSVGDDTSGVATLLYIAKQIITQGKTPKSGLIIAFTSGEEGLGNLKGIRLVMRRYGSKIKKVFAVDGSYDAVVNKCVGSERYEISLTTKGGHSYNDFGLPSAITEMASLICSLSALPLPQKAGTKTTFNVGTCEGGTSVNTIAQSAKMLCEYRSDDSECLKIMKERFFAELERAKLSSRAQITVVEVGSRPCGQPTCGSELGKMTERAVSVSKKYSGLDISVNSGSTDCNIPMSLGVPAVCVGSYYGSGQHTREEKILRKSVLIGYKIVNELINDCF